MVLVQGTNIEIVTARRESYDADSRKPHVEPATIEQDAMRRDFTVNALLQNLHSGDLYDPLGCGREDLENQILRTPLEPAATFHDDPLRMLRAVRFRWKLGFDPAPGLYEAIKTEAGRLKIISKERIHDEWVKILGHPNAPEAMQELLDLSLLHQFAPEFEVLKGVEQGGLHHLDVWDHTLLVLKNVGHNDLILSLAALLHDIAKPATRIVDEEGRIRFFGHEVLGEEMARKLLRRLKFSVDELDAVGRLVKNHMRFVSADQFTPTAARRLIRDVGDLLPRLLDLVEADAKALRPDAKTIDMPRVRELIDRVLLETPRERLDSPLQGSEIMELLNLAPGPMIGRYKGFLAEKVLTGELHPDDKEKAKSLLRTFAQSPNFS